MKKVLLFIVFASTVSWMRMHLKISGGLKINGILKDKGNDEINIIVERII